MLEKIKKYTSVPNLSKFLIKLFLICYNYLKIKKLKHGIFKGNNQKKTILYISLVLNTSKNASKNVVYICIIAQCQEEIENKTQ